MERGRSRGRGRGREEMVVYDICDKAPKEVEGPLAEDLYINVQKQCFHSTR